MLHSGPAFSVTTLDDGIVELKFDLAGESVNKINALALQDFAAATHAIAGDSSVKGIVLTSGKGVFVVGADITEFGTGSLRARTAWSNTWTACTRSWRDSRICRCRAWRPSTASAWAAAPRWRWPVITA
jgi:enoyl-CoA hydratase/carnithine racemase